MAEVWMDDYKRLFYVHRTDLKGKKVSDVSDRLALKKELNCKPFSWFLKNVIPHKFILMKTQNNGDDSETGSILRSVLIIYS